MSTWYTDAAVSHNEVHARMIALGFTPWSIPPWTAGWLTSIWRRDEEEVRFAVWSHTGVAILVSHDPHGLRFELPDRLLEVEPTGPVEGLRNALACATVACFVADADPYLCRVAKHLESDHAPLRWAAARVLETTDRPWVTSAFHLANGQYPDLAPSLARHIQFVQQHNE